jgi:hypothetical protein
VPGYPVPRCMLLPDPAPEVKGDRITRYQFPQYSLYGWFTF